jgi:hypothetical protein
MVVNMRCAPVLFRLLLVLTVSQRMWPYLLFLSLLPLVALLLVRSAAGYAFHLCSSLSWVWPWTLMWVWIDSTRISPLDVEGYALAKDSPIAWHRIAQICGAYVHPLSQVSGCISSVQVDCSFYDKLHYLLCWKCDLAFPTVNAKFQ